MTANAQTLIPIAAIGYYLYSRVRRSIGFQPFSASRMRFSLAFWGVVGLTVLVLGFRQPLTMGWAAAGAFVGAVLAFYAVKHLVKEWRDGKLYIKTHIFIEATVLALFIGRVAYKVIAAASATGKQLPLPPGFSIDSITAVLLFVAIAYYVGYNGWLLKNRESLTAPTLPSLDLNT